MPHSLCRTLAGFCLLWNGGAALFAGPTPRQKGDVWEIDNGQIRVRLRLSGGAVEQEFSARTGKQWTPIVRAFHPPAVRPAGSPGIFRNDPAVARDYRFLTTEVLDEVQIDGDALVIAGHRNGNRFEQRITLSAGDIVHIEVKAALSGAPPKLEYVWSPLVFVPGKPDFTHAPSLKRAADNVLGDRIFYSPAVILQRAALFAALVPDLDVINEAVVYARSARPVKHPRIFAVPVDPDRISMPTALDLDLASGISANPLFGYGMIDFWAEQHVFWRHENEGGQQVRELSSPTVRYAFDLLLGADAPPRQGYRRVSQYFWKRYGARHFREPRPQTMPLAQYARACYPAAFAYKGFRLVQRGGEPEVEHGAPPGYPEMETWQEFNLNGVPAGGYRNSAPQWYSWIGNTPWWNNVRDASGLYLWGRRLGNDSWVEKARRMINLALAAPQAGGAFPGIYDARDRRWIASHWKPPAHGYDPNLAERYFSDHSDVYQTAQMSYTAAQLLNYKALCEDRPGILAYVRRYAEFLLTHMGSEGMVPAWFGSDLQPLNSLKWNSDGGAHIWLLAELYRDTKDPRYLDAARRIAAAFVGQVLPEQRWSDVEAFYSCAVKPETYRDPRTGQPARSTLSMSWAMQGFSSLFDATGERRWLDAAAAVADYAALFQAVWNPHFVITAYPFGGWSSQLGDAEWLDGRQSEFATAMVRVGLLSHRQDLLERGVAAAHASLTLTNLPANVANGVYSFPHYPAGLGPENIDHEGFPQKPHRSSAGWNEVSGLTANARLLSILGGAYLDPVHNLDVGVDGVTVRGFSVESKTIRLDLENLLADLPQPYKESYPIELHFAGLTPDTYRLILNGAVQDIGAADLRQHVVQIQPK
ncbi:MAG: hypothetical protein U0Q18_36145 [Bryobacteraceae bacterium]